LISILFIEFSLFCHFDSSTGSCRRRRGGGDAVEGRDDAYYEKVLKGYEYRIENKHPDQQYCVIDATQSFESVQNEATAAVSRYFKLKTTRSDSDA
jgi:thymidylate kinase